MYVKAEFFLEKKTKHANDGNEGLIRDVTEPNRWFLIPFASNDNTKSIERNLFLIDCGGKFYIF